MAKIAKVTYKNFRVFSEQEFSIPAETNIVLLYGRNGFGKSSFFDGIEWALTGRISRFEESGTSKTELNKSTTILRNVNSSNTEESFVSINFTSSNSLKRKVTISRGIDYGSGTLETKSASNFLVAPTMKELSFEDNFNFSHLLAQEQISDFIRATDENKRFEAIVRLFGLDSYKRYNTHISEFKKHVQFEINAATAKKAKLVTEVETLNLKIQQIDAEPQVSRNRLEHWLKKTILTEEINSIISQLNTEHNTNIEQQGQAQKAMSELQSILERFDENEAIRGQHTSLLTKRKSLELFIKLLTNDEKLRRALQLQGDYDSSIIFKSEHDLKLERFQTLSSMQETSSLFRNTTKFIQRANEFAALQTNFLPQKENYLFLVNQVDEKKRLIFGLKENLKELGDASQQILLSAQQYFQLFPNSSTCPVCDNSNFNLRDTQKRIQEQLESSGNQALIAANQILTSEEKALQELLKQIDSVEKILELAINEYISSLIREFNELENYIRKINTIRQNAREYLEIYGAFELPTPVETSYLTNHAIYISSEIDRDELYVDGKSVIQYKAELQNSITKIENFYQIIQLQDNLRKKHSLETKDCVHAKIEEAQKHLDGSASALGIIEGLQKDIVVLKTATLNQELANHIRVKSEERTSIENHLLSLNAIANEYGKFELAVKATINEELNHKLVMYRVTIANVFRHLNPHVSMTKLDLNFETTASNKGRLFLQVEDDSGNSLNPAYTFSAAQNNVLALSIFLSFALKQSWSLLDSIFLDDPIQNMDDINVHAFVDIIRSTIKNRPDKQFFISTHDERVFNFMKNKFGKEKVKVFEFDGYGQVK